MQGRPLCIHCETSCEAQAICTYVRSLLSVSSAPLLDSQVETARFSLVFRPSDELAMKAMQSHVEAVHLLKRARFQPSQPGNEPTV